MLDKITDVNAKNCNPGTSVSLDRHMGYSRWRRYNTPAWFNANHMSTRIFQEGGALGRIRDDLFFLFTRTAVATDIPTDKGSAMAFKPGLIPRHQLFAPYAINRDGIVVAFDLSFSHNLGII